MMACWHSRQSRYIRLTTTTILYVYLVRRYVPKRMTTIQTVITPTIKQWMEVAIVTN